MWILIPLVILWTLTDCMTVLVETYLATDIGHEITTVLCWLNAEPLKVHAILKAPLLKGTIYCI